MKPQSAIGVLAFFAMLLQSWQLSYGTEDEKSFKTPDAQPAPKVEIATEEETQFPKLEYDQRTLFMLLHSVKIPEMQQQVGMSDDQIAEVKEISRKEYSRQLTKRRELKKQYPRAAAGSDWIQSDAFKKEMDEFTADKALREYQDLTEILSGMQLEMLRQYSLAGRGIGAINLPSIQMELDLSAEQIERLCDALEQHNSSAHKMKALHQRLLAAGIRVTPDESKRMCDEIFQEHRKQYEEEVFEILDDQQESTFRKMIDKMKKKSRLRN